jgi:broad specificity phosphatase PhoE
MSDLQCPATMLVARHGDAGYAVDGVLSDDDGALTDKGRDQVRHLVEQVRSRRVAAVYSSQMGRAVESAELAADQRSTCAMTLRCNGSCRTAWRPRSRLTPMAGVS